MDPAIPGAARRFTVVVGRYFAPLTASVAGACRALALNRCALESACWLVAAFYGTFAPTRSVLNRSTSFV